MGNRKRPVVLSTRTDEKEAAVIRTAVTLEGESVNAWARRELLRAARKRLAVELDQEQDR